MTTTSNGADVVADGNTDSQILVVLRVRAENRPEIFAIAERGLYPCASDVPLPIAERTARYLGRCGLGPVRRSRRPPGREAPPSARTRTTPEARTSPTRGRSSKERMTG